jgi:hypothetical protein
MNVINMLSLLTLALLMNGTTGNQGNHCIVAHCYDPVRLTDNNLSLAPGTDGSSCIGDPNGVFPLATVGKLFGSAMVVRG